MSLCLAVFFTGYFRHWHTVPGCARCAHSRHPPQNRRELMKIEYSPQSETACKTSRHPWPSKYHSCWGRWAVISNGDLRRQSAVLSQSCGGADADTAMLRRGAASPRRATESAPWPTSLPPPPNRSAPGGGDIEISPSADTRRQRRQRLHNIDSGYEAPTPLRRDEFSQRPKCEHRLRMMMIGAGR